ncbi:hypothetical protein RO3G_07068 [Lichtheimia corymbifera JMRC:FSU:9682]|uniref:Uncharacterized protein n=1 Tax=Lichtheimia corymbifera JMRC:FSU:9682 TaxID=1263082 RepID=A0A068S615_9FUNG|nr:hypothetical protein RO3G_07068 [Lichtheimia corymbifera JMRC:FSU:9682]
MDYFRNTQPKLWDAKQVYRSYRLVDPNATGAEIVFAIQKDLQLFSKDDDVSVAKKACQWLDRWTQLKRSFREEAGEPSSSTADTANKKGAADTGNKKGAADTANKKGAADTANNGAVATAAGAVATFNKFEFNGEFIDSDINVQADSSSSGGKRSYQANFTESRKKSKKDGVPLGQQDEALDKEFDEFFNGGTGDQNVHDDDNECVELAMPPEVLIKPKVNLGNPPSATATNIAKLFHKFKQCAATEAQSTPLYYESNLHDILSLTHVLLLKQSQHSPRQKDIIGEKLLNDIHNDILDNHSSFGNTTDPTFVNELNGIVKQAIKRPGFDRSDILVRLYMKLTKLTRGTFEYRIVKATINVLEEFPVTTMPAARGEHDLISLVIDPVLRPIFSDEHNRLRWPEVNAEERKCRTKRIERPDALLSCIHDLQFSHTRAFGEVKPISADNRSIALDFARLSVFGKDAIDVSKLNRVISFQAIGCTITFYIEVLYDNGLYVMADLHQVNLPSSIAELPDFLSQHTLDSLLDIFSTLKTISTTLDIDQWRSHHRPTLATPSFKSVISKTTKGQVCMVHL